MPSSSQESVTIIPSRNEAVKYRRPISKRPTTLRAFTFVKDWQSPGKVKADTYAHSEDADVDTNGETQSDEHDPNTESSQKMETVPSVKTPEDVPDGGTDSDNDTPTEDRNEATATGTPAKDVQNVQNNTRTKEKYSSPVLKRTLHSAGMESNRRSSIKQISSKGHSESNETQTKSSSGIEVDRQEQISSMKRPPPVQMRGSISTQVISNTPDMEIIPQSPIAEISSGPQTDALPFMDETLGLDKTNQEPQHLQPLTTPLQNKNSAKLPFTTSTPLVISRDTLPADEMNQEDQFQQSNGLLSSISGRHQRNNTIASTPIVKSKDVKLHPESNSQQPKRSKIVPISASTPMVISKDTVTSHKHQAEMEFQNCSQVPSEDIQNITVIQPIVGHSPRTIQPDKPSSLTSDLSNPSPIAERPLPGRSDTELTPQPDRNLSKSKTINNSKRKLQMKTPATITSLRSRMSENRPTTHKTVAQTPMSGPVNRIQRKRPVKKKPGLVAPSSPQKIHSVRIWQVAGRKRKAQDTSDLDVILNIVEETAFAYREEIQVPSARKSINGFASKVQRELREAIEQTQKLKRLKTDLRRVTSSIHSQRRELLLAKKENVELMQDITILEKSTQEKKKKTSKEEIQHFLLNLKKLQQAYTSTKPSAEQFQNLEDIASSSS